MGDPHGARSEQEYMEGEMVVKTAWAKSRRKATASSSRLPMWREHQRSLRRQGTWWEVGHMLTSEVAGLLIWGHKTGCHRVYQFGPQTSSSTSRRIRGTIVKLASRRSKVVKALGLSDSPKIFGQFYLYKGYLGCVLHVRVF